jgi:Ca2+-binding RTX toxin-like protein
MRELALLAVLPLTVALTLGAGGVSWAQDEDPCTSPPAGAILGSDGNDVLIGTDGPDIIVAKGGNDTVLAGGATT